MPTDDEQPFSELEQTLKKASAALRDAGIEFLLGGSLVDLIFFPKGIEVDDAVMARGEVMAVLGMEIRVMAIEDVLVTKLMALTEHSLRYESLLPIARAVREQVDWADVRARTAESPFARAFFVMLEGLGIVSPQADEPRHRTRVRVLTPPGSHAADGG